jgi:hypothetical protein
METAPFEPLNLVMVVIGGKLTADLLLGDGMLPIIFYRMAVKLSSAVEDNSTTNFTRKMTLVLKMFIACHFWFRLMMLVQRTICTLLFFSMWMATSSSLLTTKLSSLIILR